METALDKMIEFLLSQSMHLAVLFAVIGALVWLLNKRSAHVRYLLWLIILVKCLIPPLLTIPLAVLPEQVENPVISASPGPQAEHEVPLAAAEPQPQYIVVKSQPDSAAGPAIRELVFTAGRAGIVWICGSILYLTWILICAVRFQIRLKQRRIIPEEPLKKEIEDMAEQFWPTLKVRAYLLEGISQPFVWGLWRGSIYLPANFARTTAGRKRQAILLHEMAHVARADALVNLIQGIAQGIYWFHPLVWIANRIIRSEREKCCDETAIAKLKTTPKEYGWAIVEVLTAEYHSRMAIPSLAVAGPAKNIEDRLKTIMNPKRKFYARPTFIGLCTVLFLASILIPTAIALTHKKLKVVQPVDFEITSLDFRPGDSIEITEILGDRPRIEVGGTYTIIGKYTLSSQDRAMLHLFAIDGQTRSGQASAVQRGAGEFVRTFTYLEEGDLHLSFYPAGGGSSLGGLYFAAKSAAQQSQGPVDIAPADFDIHLDENRGLCFLVVSIQNNSEYTLPKHRTRYYHGNPDRGLDEAGNPHSGWHEAGPIEPGRIWNERTRDFHLPDGEYEFTVVLDYDRVVSETDETNNIAAMRVRIQNGQLIEKSPLRPGGMGTVPQDTLQETTQKQVAIEARLILTEDSIFQEDETLFKMLAGRTDETGDLLDQTKGTVVTGRVDSPPIERAVEGFQDFSPQFEEGQILDDLQTELLLKTLQRHETTKCLTAPKVLVFNNEPAVITVETETPYKQVPRKGTKIFVRPVLAPDGSTVELKLRVQVADLLEPEGSSSQKQEPPIVQITDLQMRTAVPGRGTLLIKGPLLMAQTQGGQESTAKERIPMRLLVLVKPSIIPASEDTNTAPVEIYEGNLPGGMGEFLPEVAVPAAEEKK